MKALGNILGSLSKGQKNPETSDDAPGISLETKPTGRQEDSYSRLLVLV